MPHSRVQDPESRIGVFKRLADVPDRFRLYHYAEAYDGEDTWSEYLASEFRNPGPDIQRHGEEWRSHMADRRHHALAQPEDVEAWAAELLEEYAPVTAMHRWNSIEPFYWWLLRNPDRPHLYHPVLQAAVAGGNAREIWTTKMRQARGQL